MADAMFEVGREAGHEAGHESGAPARVARLEGLAADALAFVRAASPMTRIGLVAALALLRFAPLLLFYSWRPLDRLDRDRRREVLALVERSPLGVVLVAWRTILVLHFYEDARELASIGYRDDRKRHLATIPAAAISGVRLREDVEHDHDHDHDHDQDDADADGQQGAA